MIPDQPLNNRRNEPIACLSWVSHDAMQGLMFISYPETFLQLTDVFHSVAVSYGLQLPEPIRQREAFQKACFEPGAALVCPPKLYLRCNDQKRYLCFDWARWLNETNYILGLSDS
ncbi:hypothetical protein [Acanthopleuribacter pedis]|uniref:Uncharacterized protein n=1 Tax=Acanthopleuribacter pedis TaxID=442870 RepID=A0A8J7QUS2_9BACT|nr:hypothetical protein [Acanthopleuribacter pedis]MBO1323393.1 hypothetical protein [Acanthopleuribacter pedis]